MYNISITNNYIYSVFMDGGNMIICAPGDKGRRDNWGSHSLQIGWMGDINFIDMGDYKIPQFTHKEIPWTNFTWGGLIRYQGLEAYFRYEGQGQVNLTIDRFGGVNVNFPQGGMMVSLDDLRVV
jgi:hypothetical protein